MTSELHAYYAARAGEYDAIYAKPERQVDLRQMERWLPAQLSGRRVLEVACGTGYWTQFIAPVARRVVAIDAAPETLDIARKRGWQGDVSFHLGDAYHIPQDLRSFDAAFAGFWFSHVRRSRREEFLRSLNEHLEADSPVILLDNLFVAGSSTPIAEWDEEGNTYQLRALADGTMHRVLKNFPTEGEILPLAERFGRKVQFIRWQYYWGLLYLTPTR